MIWCLILLTTLTFQCMSQLTESSTCNNCCQGPIGPQGAPGIPGVPGSHGTNAIPVSAGPKGESGNAGEPGPRGNQGVSGEPGLMGERGAVGKRGLPGKVGPPGQQGLTGFGEAGPRGLTGMKGERGVPGQFAVTRRSAFTAVKTSAQAGNVNDVVLFQSFVTDIGNDYDTSTSKFTCRVPGVYVFMFSFNTDNSPSDTIVTLVQNNQILVGAHIDNQPRDDQIGNGAVAHLAVGDQVWIKFVNNDNQHVHTSRTEYHISSFSGLLLYED